MPADAVARYHDLLTDRLAADSQAHLDAQTRHRGMLFGDRPVCTVLRPRFLTVGQYRLLRRAVQALLPAFAKLHDAALADATLRARFGLRDWEESLLAIDPGFRDPWPTSRLDAFFASERELKFTEYNTETPAGAAYTDALAEMFAAMPVMREFQRRHHLLPVPARPGVLAALLGAYEQWAGSRSDPPRIAVLDWREVPTFSEFVLFTEYFRSHGLECRIVDPREVEYRGGRLVAGDYHVTLIYKRVLISELLERGGANHAVVRAVRDGAACMVNPFRCKLLYKKASFAALGDERNARLFTDADRRAVAEYVPWTRVVVERHTTYGGEPIDLVPFALANRERLVLKPNDEYGGKGIVLGWTVDQPAWEAALRAALAEPFVVQERVTLPREPYPGYENGRLVVLDRTLDTDPFVTGGAAVSGCLTRISTEALLNVTAGGGSTVPTFLIDA